MIKKSFLFLVLFFFLKTSFSQELEKLRFKAEIGAIGGVAYYQGDINPSKLFYSPNAALGAFYTYNFSSRIATRLSLVSTNLSGNDLDFDNVIQQTRAHQFSIKLTEISALMTFNFFSLNPTKPENIWSPYLIGGLAGYAVSNSTKSDFRLCFPIGFGLKICPSDRLSIGLEWVYRITNDNNIDQLFNSTYQQELNSSYQNRQKSFNYVTDYYSLANLTISFRIFEFKKRCAAYGYKKK